MTAASRRRARTTIWVVTVVVGMLIAAMWATVSVSIVASRRVALADAHSQGRNLMIAFREESP